MVKFFQPHLLSSRKKIIDCALVTLGVAGFVFSGAQINGPRQLEAVAVTQKPIAKSVPASTVPKTMTRSEPTTVRISRLGIGAPLTPIDLRADETLDVPSAYNQAGWYVHAPTPGELGPAIIDGHVDSATNGIAVFWRLREVQPGDVIEVDRADGTTARFKIDSIKQFPQDQFPTQEIYGNINYAGIRLITCGGVFNTQTHHYSDNIVVFGSLI